MFEVTYHQEWKLFELIPFALVGGLGGLIGTFIHKMNVRVCRFRKTSHLKKWPVGEVMGCAFVTSVVDYTIVYLRGSSMVLLSALFSECKNSNLDTFEELCNHENGREILFFLLLSAAIKTLLTIITFGNPCPGGVFVPALVIGGLMGRAVGFSLQLLENEMGDVGLFSPCRSTTSCITPGVTHHPTPFTLIPNACTLNPHPYTLSPKPLHVLEHYTTAMNRAEFGEHAARGPSGSQTPNPKPQTLRAACMQ